MNCRYGMLTLSLGLLLVSGCSRSSFRTGRVAANTLPPTVAAEFAYARPADSVCKIKVVETRPEYTVRRISLPAPTDVVPTNRWVELDYYDLPTKEKTPVIMVLPMLGGGYALERHFANYFASRGYASVIVRRDPRTKSAPVEQLNQLFKDMVIDHKRVIDWLETQDDLDCSRLGIFGVSMGGIKGALLLPLEGRIQAAAIGLCGGDLPYILTRTTEPGLTKRREQEMRERNITLEECEARLREVLKHDPMRYARYVDPKKVLLVLARYDDVVPIEKGLELKEQMGNPETIMIPAGHYTAALSIPYIKSQSFDFFEKRFAEAAGTVVAKRGGGLTKVQAGRR
jgi:dienelactone hydrolase